MAGKFKVDVRRGEAEWRRRSSHKTLEDASLQSSRFIKKEPKGDVQYRVTLDGATLEIITRSTQNET